MNKRLLIALSCGTCVPLCAAPATSHLLPQAAAPAVAAPAGVASTDAGPTKPIATAQGAEIPALAAPRPEPQIYAYLKVRHVSPAYVAWWLDPQNNPLPEEIAAARALVSGVTDVGAKTVDLRPRVQGRHLELPSGIKSLKAVVPQNAVLTLGTMSAVQQLEELVGLLDRPLRKVDIETRQVLTTAEGLKALGLETLLAPAAVTAGEPAAISVAFAPSRLNVALARLQEQGRAKILSAPRSSATNNLPTLSYETLDLDPQFTPTSFAGVFPTAQFMVGVRRRLIVTPTVKTDDTMTVGFTASVAGGVVHAGTGKGRPVVDRSSWVGLPDSSRSAHAVVEIRDSETVALYGGSIGATSTAGPSALPNGAPAITVMLVTVRIIRPVEEPVPGV